MNQEVTDYIAQIKLPWQSEICSKLREVIHEAIPEVAERTLLKQASAAL
ncbi:MULTISPECIES: hypothetical protein [unclassified Paenibacillus]